MQENSKNKNEIFNFNELWNFFSSFKDETLTTTSKLNHLFLQNDLIFLTIFIVIFTYIIFFIKSKKAGFFTFNFNSILINCLFILIYFFTNLNFENNINIFEIYFNIFFVLFFLLYNKIINKIYNYEEFLLLILILFSTKLLLLSNNVVTLILLIEIQTFCILILNLSNKQNILKSETTLKYFIISSITSGLLLFGFSNLYFFTGSLNLNEILLFMNFINIDINTNIYLFFSIFLIFISLIIKLGFFPFHNWLLDLYNGFSYNLIFIMFIFQKPILFFLLYKIFSFYSFFFYYNTIIINFVILISIFSIIIGSIGIILQSNIKKFLAYSSLVTNSYLLLLLLNDYFYFNIFFIIFIIIYNLNNFLFFFFFQYININFKIKNLLEIYNYYYINKFMTILFIITLFSFLGLPPFSGFFSKYFILFILNLNNFLNLTIIILILNIISSFYYLKIIKLLISNEKFSYNTNSLEYLNNKNKKILQISDSFIYDIFIFIFIINLSLFFKLDFFIYLQNIIK
jgi:proton-translocating NADH-quinone oxidoreductase chain N